LILVDTSVWVDFLRGTNSPERRALHALIEREEDLALTGIVLTEVLQGVKSDKDFRELQGYLLEFPFFQPDSVETYLHAARIYRDCRKKGKTVRKTVDCIIAAVCIEHGLTLLHKDSDFSRIEACTRLRCYRA
jgi:predicted nucleic acid-binding protein